MYCGDVLALSYDEQGIVVNELPWDTVHNGEIYFIKNNNTTYLTHGIHKYAGKYIPQIPSWAIKNAQYRMKKEHLNILDPFCGSGTTLLEAATHGCSSVGIDIDPLACLVSRVKTRTISDDVLLNLNVDFWNIFEMTTSNYMPNIDNFNHWFNENNIEHLSRLYETIRTYQSSTDLFELLLVTLSSIIRKSSNADNRSLKTYVSHTHIKKVPDALEAFRSHLKRNIARLIELNQVIKYSETYVHNPASSSESGYLPVKESFDCVITSPPYIKSMDYLYNQMLEVLWLGPYLGINGKDALNQYKKLYIGSQVRDKKYIPLIGIDEIDSFIGNIFKLNPKHAAICAQYFSDISDHLSATYDLLIPNGEYYMVVGNSNVSGIEVPVNRFVQLIAIRQGFTVNFDIGYIIRKHYMIFPRVKSGGLITTDWIINFRK